MSRPYPFPQVPISVHDELLNLFKYILPDRNCWFHPGQLAVILSDGGFRNLPTSFVSESLRSRRKGEKFFKDEKYQNKRWYCFDPDRMKFASPRDQAAGELWSAMRRHAMRHASASGMTSSHSSLHHWTKQHHPLLLLAASITIFVSLARATRFAAAFAPPAVAGRTVPSHPRSRRHAYSSGEPPRKMAPTPESDRANILESPSAERNKVPIYGVLEERVLPRLVERAIGDGRDKVRVLELAAGCGVHTTHFATSFLSSNEKGNVGLEWHPSDPDAEARLSIDARVRRAGLEGSVVPANGWILGRTGGTACGDRNRDRGDAGMSQSGKDGDSAEYERHRDCFDLALCINMIHISPWEATLGLMECAGRVLRKGGMLVCYGPYKVDGTAVESNLNFDMSLRSRNSDWGVRNLEDVVDVGKREGLEFVQSVEMPANNLSVLFRKG